MSHVMTSNRGRIGQRRRRLPPGSTAEQTSTVSASDARLVSWLISAGLVITTSTLFCAFVPALWHWLIVPTSVAGVLLGVDAVDWVRGRLETFQPRAVVALFGLHLCYLGPLLHVALDYWPRYVSPAQDWRQSLALLGVVNASGLLIYRFVLSLRPAPRGPRVAHRLDERRLITASSAVVAVGFGALVVLLLAFGGPAQYLRVVAGHRELLAGRGWLLLLAESWPMVLFMTVLVTGRRWLRASTPLTLATLAAFVVAQLVVGGLRGSRAETVWPAITAAVLVHLLVRPITRRALVAGMLVLIGFTYVYGFYKTVGAEVLRLADDRTTIAAMSAETGRTFELLLLEDFGRAGTQSLVIDRLGSGGELSWGATYVGDVIRLAPDAIAPTPDDDKVAAGTELLNGAGSYAVGERSSRIYGLAGEGMINFGLVGGIVAFLPFAVLVRWADRYWSDSLAPDDPSAKLLAAWLPATVIVALASDLDNVLWMLIKQAMVMILVVFFARTRATERDG